MGFNPYFHSAPFIHEELSGNAVVSKIHKSVDYVYFYGAGASSESLKDIIHDGLKPCFQTRSDQRGPRSCSKCLFYLYRRTGHYVYFRNGVEQLFF